MRKFQDTYRHKGLRQKLTDSLREKGITDEQVLAAINNIPRHYFLDTALDTIAYEDRAFPISSGQTISQPYTVAFQTELLKIKPKEKVLEIGTGSVYQASVLAEMGAYVFTIERQKALFEMTKHFVLKKKYPNIKFFYGDGFLGLPSFGPFDKIIITAGAPFVPPSLIDQLKPAGIMVIPLNEDDKQRMIRITKQENGSLTEEAFQHFSFVPMLSGKETGENKLP